MTDEDHRLIQSIVAEIEDAVTQMEAAQCRVLRHPDHIYVVKGNEARLSLADFVHLALPYVLEAVCEARNPNSQSEQPATHTGSVRGSDEPDIAV